MYVRECVFCAHVILWAISVTNQPTATPNAGHARGLASHKAAMDCRGPDMKSSAIERVLGCRPGRVGLGRRPPSRAALVSGAVRSAVGLAGN